MFPKPIGIISCGGLSSRMKVDKSLLEYLGKPHRYYLYDLIKPFCNNVFLSCNKNQVTGIDENYNYILDKSAFEGHGPVSGLLSCYADFTNDAFLFIGCDYPHITSFDIKLIIESRSIENVAVCYTNEINIPEPLISLFENQGCKFILERFKTKKYSLREFLEVSKTKIISSNNEKLFRSIDTPEQYQDQIRIKK